MKRHESLHPLSQHHHFALIQVWEIRRALGLPEPERVATARDAAGKFVQFYRERGFLHFREEEEELLPIYARHVSLDQDPHVIRMLAEHAAIRSLVTDLESALGASAPLDDLLSRVATLLHDHIRLEENEIFPTIERTLTESELQAVAPHLHRLHAKDECSID